MDLPEQGVVDVVIAEMRFRVEVPTPQQVDSLRQALRAKGAMVIPEVVEQLKRILHPADWSTVAYRVCQQDDPLEGADILQLARALAFSNQTESGAP